MKKVLMALCAAGLLMLSACKDEPVTPSNSEPSTPEVPTGDGVYMPSAKIAKVIRDEEETERWNWDGNLLMSIDRVEMGEYVPMSVFAYTNSRLQTLSGEVQGTPITATFNYNGNLLTSVSASSDGTPMADILLEHNASDQVSRLTLDVNSDLLGMLSQLLGEGFGKARPSKLALDGTAVNVDLVWQGENVVQEIISAEVNGRVTLGEVRQMVNIDSLAGAFSGLLALIDDTTSFPLTVSVLDTISMTYDDHPNPLQGFLGALQASALSANNVLTSVSSGTATITISIVTPYTTFPFTLPYPIPSQSQTYTYTYNAAGYPETITTEEGSVTQYVYQE